MKTLLTPEQALDMLESAIEDYQHGLRCYTGGKEQYRWAVAYAYQRVLDLDVALTPALLAVCGECAE